MYTQYFFISGQLVGQAQRKPAMYRNLPGPPLSYSFYCEYCGDTFARCPVVDKDNRQSPWLAIRRICSSCGGKARYLSQWPGALDPHNSDSDFVNTFPLKVLHLELLAHLDHFERIFNDNSAQSNPSRI